MEAGIGEANLRTVRSDWANTILVCKKCSKKLGGGFGPKGKTSLAKALRQDLGVRKGRKGALGIIEVKCLGVCPKGAVTVVNGAKPGEWALVAAQSDVAEIVDGLGLRSVGVPAAAEVYAKVRRKRILCAPCRGRLSGVAMSKSAEKTLMSG